MPKDGSRIDNLLFALAAADVWYKATQIIKKETGIELEDEPERAMAAARKKLAQLQKK